MGTNYYAEWNVGGNGNGNGPIEFVIPASILHLHICKSLSSFQGQMFNSWSAWRNFLLNQRGQITIRDEYGVVHEVDQFISDVEAIPDDMRRRQYQWVADHGRVDRTDPDDWADPQGYSFHRGEFF